MTEAPLPHPSVFLGQQRLKVIRGYRVHEQRTPSQDIHVITPSQTIGPFFGVGLVRPGDEDLACKQPRGARAEGTPIIIQGQVMDENGKPVRKALIEVWQANRWGKYEHPDDTTQAPLEQAYQAQLEKAVRWTAQPEERA